LHFFFHLDTRRSLLRWHGNDGVGTCVLLRIGTCVLLRIRMRVLLCMITCVLLCCTS